VKFCYVLYQFNIPCVHVRNTVKNKATIRSLLYRKAIYPTLNHKTAMVFRDISVDSFHTVHRYGQILPIGQIWPIYRMSMLIPTSKNSIQYANISSLQTSFISLLWCINSYNSSIHGKLFPEEHLPFYSIMRHPLCNPCSILGFLTLRHFHFVITEEYATTFM
jgi:hypothetical protein